MLRGEVGAFVDFLIEVVEARVRLCVVLRLAFGAGVALRHERELPRALAHGLEVVAGEVIVRLSWRVFALAKEQRGEVATVEHGLRRHFGSGDFQAGGMHVDGAGDGIAYAAGRDLARPPRERGDAHAAFPGGAFAAAQGTGAAAIRAFDEPGAVVAGEDDERVRVELQLAQRVEHTTDAGIDLLHPVAKAAVLRAALEGLAGMDGRVHSGVREVEEEGLRRVLGAWFWVLRCLGAADELHGLVGVDFLDAVLVRLVEQALDLVIAHERHDAAAVHARRFEHVIGIRDAEVVIKALLCGQKRRLIAEVPLADALRGVAERLQAVGDGVLLRMQPVLRPRRIHTRHGNACAIASSHDLRPRHAAHRRGIERRELHPLPRHAVEMRRLLLHRTEGPNVAVAEVVDEVDDDVGLRSSRAERRGEGEEAEEEAHFSETGFLWQSYRCG